LAFSRLGRVIVEPAIKLQLSSYQPNDGRVNGDNRAFLKRFIIVKPVFRIREGSEAD